jgi:hypothetical protein
MEARGIRASLGQERVPESMQAARISGCFWSAPRNASAEEEFWLYFNAAPEDVNTAPEDVDEVCREISVGIELLGFQPLIRFA